LKRKNTEKRKVTNDVSTPDDCSFMNILQLTNKIPYPPVDGGAIAVLNLSLGLAEMGHKVTILAMNTDKHYSDINQIPVAVKTSVYIIPVNVHAKITFTGALKNLLLSNLPYTGERFISTGFRKKLTGLLKENKFDVVQIEGLYLTNYIRTVRKNSNAIIALRSHNIEHEIWLRIAEQETNLFRKIYFKVLAKRIIALKAGIVNTYDLLVPITQRDANVYRRFGNTRPVRVIQAGINLRDISPNKDFTRPSVFFIGALDWIPNQEGLIWFIKNVWKGIRNKFEGLEFHIAGRNAPQKLIDFICMEPGIVYHGEVVDSKLFITSYRVMVVPLFSGSGMRVKIVEGMALKRLIVTTALGAEGIGAVNGEHILIAETSEEFVNAVSLALNDTDLYTNIPGNARKFIEKHFDNETITGDLIDFYRQFTV